MPVRRCLLRLPTTTDVSSAGPNEALLPGNTAMSEIQAFVPAAFDKTAFDKMAFDKAG